MTLAELLKSANIAEDVIAGLPKEVSTTLEGYVSEADTKLQSATTEAEKAEEARRQAELERQEINQYVEKYGTSLTQMADVQAKYDATLAYLKTLKAQGFDIKFPGVEEGAKPVVPGSPAMGANAVDENKILGRVGDVMGQYLDANNEHIRLFGVPLPDSSLALGEEAARARKPIGVYIAEKYKFKERQTTKEQEAFQKRVDDAVKLRLDEALRAEAEKRGSNPNLRPGESSRSSFVPKIKGEEFHKSDGNVPTRERHQRLLQKVHADVEAARANA